MKTKRNFAVLFKKGFEKISLFVYVKKKENDVYI